MDMDNYLKYLRTIRLPLFLAGHSPPEMAVYEEMTARIRADGCDSNNDLDIASEILDPVSYFPLFVRLGYKLISDSGSFNYGLSLDKESEATDSKRFYLRDPDARWKMLYNRLPEIPRSADFYGNVPFHAAPIGISSTVMLPVDNFVDDRYPNYIRMHHERFSSPQEGRVFANEKLDLWQKAFERLASIMDHEIDPSGHSRAPYFLGFIPDEIAFPIVQKHGFFDLALMGGNVTHGTAPHMLQRAKLQETGRGREILQSMTVGCWKNLFDKSGNLGWSNGVGFNVRQLNLSNEIHAIYDIPFFNVAASMQRLLTHKVLSRFIDDLIATGSQDEINQVKALWLKTELPLKDVSRSVKALENTVLAEHLNQFRLILRTRACDDIFLTSADSSGDTFFTGMYSSECKEGIVHWYENRGFTVERMGWDEYILTPPRMEPIQEEGMWEAFFDFMGY